jgi:stress-induced morphogen
LKLQLGCFCADHCLSFLAGAEGAAGAEAVGKSNTDSGKTSSNDGSSTEHLSKWEPTAGCPKPVAASIKRKLKALGATEVAVMDESADHAGHAGSRSTVSPSGETHLRVRVVAEAFIGLSTVKRHRLVFTELAEELAGPVHALSLVTQAPAEVS